MHRIIEVMVQEGFESKKVFQVVDGAGKIYATCDSRADARLELKNLDPLANQKADFDRAEAKAVDKSLEKERRAASQALERQTRAETSECSKNDIRKANQEAKDGKLDVEAHHKRIQKMSPILWADGSETSERERYQLGNRRYAESDNEFEWYTSNPDKLGKTEEEEESGPGLAQIQMEEAVNKLSRMQRKVWELCGREMRISFEDAALILGITKSSVQTHYSRATKHLKAFLDIK